MYIILVAALGLALFLIQAKLYKHKWKKNLNVKAFFTRQEAKAGEEASLTEVIENVKALPLPVVKMKLQLSRKLLFRENENTAVSDFFNRTDIYSIKPYEKVTRTITFLCKERGYYDFNCIDVIGSDLFLWQNFVETYDSNSNLYVFPKPFEKEIIEPLLDEINGEIKVKKNLVTDPFEYKGIREYQPYDSMKNINWKASAKTDDLLVNERDYTAKRRIKILINFENATILKRDELLEMSMSIAIASVIYFSRLGISVGIYGNSKDYLTDDPLFVDLGCGEGHVNIINRALARVDLNKEASVFDDKFVEKILDEDKESFVIVLSPNETEEFQKTLIKIKNSGRDLRWICPVYKNSQFEVRSELKDIVRMIGAEEALYEISLS